MSDSKYGWEICDEVQRFVSNVCETEYVPKSALEAAQAEIAELKTEIDRLQQYNDASELRVENARLKEIAKDHEDDWKRIQDAERKLAWKERDHFRNECHGQHKHIIELRDENERLKGKLKELGHDPD